MRKFLSLFFFLALFFTPFASAQDAALERVTLTGSILAAVGCDADAPLACSAAELAFDEEDQLWRLTLELPAGSYTYGAVVNGSLDIPIAVDEGGNALTLDEAAEVTFLYEPASGWLTDSASTLLVNVPGSFQSEIGCPDDWSPWCLRTWLQDVDGDGVFTYATTAIPAGAYEAKVAANETWSVNWGQNGTTGGANIPFVVPEDNAPVEFRFNTADNLLTIIIDGQTGSALAGNLFTAQAHWVRRDTLLWDIGRVPGATYRLHYSPDGRLDLTETGITGGSSILLTPERDGAAPDVAERFPQLARYTAFTIGEADIARVPEILTGQIAVEGVTPQGAVFGATLVQIPGVLDDLYTYDGPLGVTWVDGVPTLRVWAPTARDVSLLLYADSVPQTGPTEIPMVHDPTTGVWSLEGEAGWKNQFYLFAVDVYVPSERSVVRNIVTDPYSLSLSMNSARSQLVDLSDPSLAPQGWTQTTKPPLDAFEDMVVYELHVRDFSIYDETVRPEYRGTFMAFTEDESNGMRHLRALAEAGVTHIHLLPAFDIATIQEDAALRQEPDRTALTALPPDSPEQQALIEPLRDLDGFNWGYDPFHFTVPEGSYSTQPDGTTRILEFRRMVQSLNDAGLRVVMDVVYNHTNASGQSPRSVLDRIVPGYYHRLNGDGGVETSTCCANTATEHAMMERLMIDSVRTWATAYRVDGFRFDLMGHHMRDNMLHVREALDALTVETDGVDGRSIALYGEGWNFGEVANDARGVHATQLNMAGTGIATFNDRLRDAVRGGGPFSPLPYQGFATGLALLPNGLTEGSADEQAARLALAMDQVRVGLAGNLRDYRFVNSLGAEVSGQEVDYNGSTAGYTADPQEQIVYVSAHDNETIFDAVMGKAPLDAPLDLRIRMNNLALSTVAFSQGIPFFHAGDDLLRSKSFDRNSYNSGDWFNALDFTYQSNNFGVGLPPASDNEATWDYAAPLLANPALSPSPQQIQDANAVFREYLQIRRGSPLFRLRTAEDIQQRVRFFASGPTQTPGVIAMLLDDSLGDDLDPTYFQIMVIFNATPEEQVLPIIELSGLIWELHPVMANSVDPVVRSARGEEGIFTVPAYTTAVFVVGLQD